MQKTIILASCLALILVSCEGDSPSFAHPEVLALCKEIEKKNELYQKEIDALWLKIEELEKRLDENYSEDPKNSLDKQMTYHQSKSQIDAYKEQQLMDLQKEHQQHNSEMNNQREQFQLFPGGFPKK